MSNYLRQNKSKKNKPQEIHKTVTNDNGVEKKVVIKATTPDDISVARYARKQKSYNGLRVVNGKIYEEQKKALRYPEAYRTFNEMMLDEAVALGYNTKRILLWLSMSKFKINVGKSKSSLAKEAQEFVQYCFENLDQSWYEVVMNATTYPKYGFSLLEAVPTKITSGKYKGKLKFKRFSPISAKSVDEWLMSEDQSKVLAITQSTAYLDTGVSVGALNTSVYSNYVGTEIKIPYNRLLHWAYNAESGNPIGESQFKACYNTWLEKSTISEYECVGISKDLGKQNCPFL